MDQISARVHEIDILITRIAGVDAPCGEFARAWAEAEIWATVEEVIRNKASRARQVRNALLPIQQLPTEVVLQVLCMVVPPFLEQADYYMVLRQVSGVCHRWRQIINSTPTLWGRIHSWDSAYVVKEALKRSAHHALDVYFDNDNRIRPMGRAERYNFVENLIPHLGRCRKLALGWDSDPRQVKELLGLPAPQLEQLILRDEIGNDDFATVEIFAGQAAFLKQVEIDRVACRWESAAFKGLKSLSISNVSFQSFNQILELLQYSPTLLKLKLQHIIFPDSDADIDPMFRQIRLPLLNNLQIRSIHWRRTESLLGCIHAPGCAHLHLTMDDVETGIEGSLARLPALWPSQVRIIILNLRSIRVVVKEVETALFASSSDGQGGLSLVLRRGAYFERSAILLGGINHIIKNYLSAPESSLQVDSFTLHCLHHGNILNEILRLPTVTRLDLGDPLYNYEMPYACPHEDQHWTLPPFPSLKLIRCFTPREDWVMRVIGAAFHNPTIDAQNRAIDIQVHSRTEQANEDCTSRLAPRIRAVIGESNRDRKSVV